MTYRHAEFRESCSVCETGAPQNCSNCSAPHCSDHLVQGACASCASQLWALERRKMHVIGGAYGAAGIPLAAMALFASFSASYAWLMAPIVFLLLAGYFGLTSVVRPLIRKSVATKALAPGSTKLLPPGPSLKAPAQDGDWYRKAGARRRRRRPAAAPKYVYKHWNV